VAKLARDGDMVMTMGAGDIYKAGEMLLDKLSGKRKSKKDA
jgi:UDP-N-acetylmuramate-alanine ligase